MPARFFKGFRSEASFSYTQTSLFTRGPPASRMTSVASHLTFMSGYQTQQTTVEKLKGPYPFLNFYLPIKILYCSIKQKWWCVWDEENESDQCRSMWRLSGTIFHHRSWLDLFTSVSQWHRSLHKPCYKPAFPALLTPQTRSALSPEVSSPQPSWQSLIRLPLHLTSQLLSLTPALGPGKWDTHFLWPPVLCTFFFKASPKLDNHFQQSQVPRLSTTCNTVTFSPCPPHPSPAGPCRVFTKPVLPVAQSLISRCHALPLAPQWVSTALCLALCSGIGFRIQPLKRLKRTWLQDTSAKKIYAQMTLKAGELNISRQKSKENIEM